MRADRLGACAEIPASHRAHAGLLACAAGRYLLTGTCPPSRVPDLNSPLTKAKTTPWSSGQPPTPATASSTADPTTSRGGAT